MITKNGLKTAALSFGVAVLFGTLAIGCGGTDSVEKSSESQHSETVTAAPQPAVVTQEHSSSNSSASESSPSGNSASEKSSSSKSTTY
jgi:hypothetical protein